MSESFNNVIGSYEAYQREKRTVINNSMDKDMFFKILVTQLQNQDPTNPMEDRDFISQLAQFTSLESMQDMSANSVKMYAYSMVGKNVTARCYDTANGKFIDLDGRVDSVSFENGIPLFSVGGYKLTSENITAVYEKSDVSVEQA